MIILKDCSHFLQDEKPVETTKYVVQFLKDINKKSHYDLKVTSITDTIKDMHLFPNEDS